MDPMNAYIEGWCRHDADAILATLVDDCTVIESYGPVYRGADRVRQWISDWVGAGGRVQDWVITSQLEGQGFAVVEWTFTCIWNGERSTFDGVTVVRLRDGRIEYLREYRTDGELYDWSGKWR